MSDPLNKISPTVTPLMPWTLSQSTQSPAANAFHRTISSAPPSYSQSMAANKPQNHSTDSPLPPPYIPVDCSALLKELPTDVGEVSYDHCLDVLTEAYGFDVAELAHKIRGHYVRGLHTPMEVVVPKLLRSTKTAGKNPELAQLAQRLSTVFKNSWRDIRSLSEAKQMACIICLYFLEQKALVLSSAAEKNATGEPGASLAPNQAALIRKEFFQLFDQLTKSDKVGLGDLQEKIAEYLADDERAELRADLKSEVPLSQDLTLSQLRYEQIPGTTVCTKLRPPINNYNQIYGINFYDLIEAIGDIDLRSSSSPDFPIQKFTYELLRKNDPKVTRLSVKKELYFLDRNARFVIAGMDHFHKAAFDAQPYDEKQPLPVQESAACGQKKAEVMQEFMQYFLDRLKAAGINSARGELTNFMADKWPRDYIPEQYRDGKMPPRQ